VEDVARYMMDFAWNPDATTYESFWQDFARRCFGPKDADEMSRFMAAFKEIFAAGKTTTAVSNAA